MVAPKGGYKQRNFIMATTAQLIINETLPGRDQNATPNSSIFDAWIQGPGRVV